MSTRIDEKVLREVACPLCGQKGTLRLITPKRRLRLGPISFISDVGKTHECTRCGAKV